MGQFRNSKLEIEKSKIGARAKGLGDEERISLNAAVEVLRGGNNSPLRMTELF